jgi:hypothetical protein
MTRSKKNLSVLEIAQGRLARSERHDIEPAGDRFMAQMGFTSIHLSQSRATQQTPGISDRRYYNTFRRVKCWWEAKSENGKQTEAEWKFQQLVEACGEVYLLGTEQVLADWCRVGCPSGDVICTNHLSQLRDLLQPKNFRWQKPKPRKRKFKTTVSSERFE